MLAALAAKTIAPPPYDWESDLAIRVAKSVPSLKARGFFLQAYLQHLRSLDDEALMGQALALCGPGPLIELFEYPVRLQLELLALRMPSLVAQYGDGTAALRMVGREDVMRFVNSTTGRMLIKLTGRDPKRLLSHTPLGYRMSSALGEQTQQWYGSRTCHWVMRDQMMPLAFHEGIMLGLLDWGGARNARVMGRQLNLLDSEYDITWD